MCGINGILSRDHTKLTKIANMNNLLSHRGPDDEGFIRINSSNGYFTQYSGNDTIDEIKNKFINISDYINDESDIVLASRRLSILDVSSNGHMPMHDTSYNYWITYNGAIYNYIELRFHKHIIYDRKNFKKHKK